MNQKYKLGGLIFLSIILLLGTLPSTGVAAREQPSTKVPGTQVSYPYFPSLIRWNKSAAEFTEPETCGECHDDKYEEWTGSMHALAFKDPIYLGELNAAIKAVGPKIAKQCEGCHSPVGMITGEIKGAGLKDLSPIARAGVSCDVCHSISGHTHWQTPTNQPGNGSFILTPGKVTAEGKVLIKHGPLKPDADCGEDFHECKESPLHLRSELCASCHQVFHYKANTPLESTYQEWKQGIYYPRNIHCQDCHMVDIKTFKRSADKFIRPKIDEYRHYFNGANFLIYYLTELAAKKAGDEDLAKNVNQKYKMAIDRLQAAADLEISPIYSGKNMKEIKIRVKNIRAGHNIPTSLTNIRQIWLEVTVKDVGGKVLMTTGILDEGGKLPKDVRIFNSVGQDENFQFAIDPWEIYSFSKHNTIPPRGYRDVYFGISMKKGVPLTVEARLRYRQADQKVAEKLLGLVPKDIHLETIYGIKKVPALPVIDMVSRKVVINQ